MNKSNDKDKYEKRSNQTYFGRRSYPRMYSGIGIDDEIEKKRKKIEQTIEKLKAERDARPNITLDVWNKDYSIRPTQSAFNSEQQAKIKVENELTKQQANITKANELLVGIASLRTEGERLETNSKTMSLKTFKTEHAKLKSLFEGGGLGLGRLWNYVDYTFQGQFKAIERFDDNATNFDLEENIKELQEGYEKEVNDRNNFFSEFRFNSWENAKEKIREGNKTKKELTKSLEKAKNENNELQKKYDTLYNAVGAYRTKWGVNTWGELDTLIWGLQTREKGLKQDKQNLTDEKAKLEADVINKDNRISTLQKLFLKGADILDTQYKNIVNLKAQLEKESQDGTASQEQVAHLQKDIERLDNEKQELEQAKRDLKAQASLSEQEKDRIIRQLRVERDNANTLLEQAKHKIDGEQALKGMLASQVNFYQQAKNIRYKDPYKPATTYEDALEVMQYLVSSATGPTISDPITGQELDMDDLKNMSLNNTKILDFVEKHDFLFENKEHKKEDIVFKLNVIERGIASIIEDKEHSKEKGREMGAKIKELNELLPNETEKQLIYYLGLSVDKLVGFKEEIKTGITSFHAWDWSQLRTFFPSLRENLLSLIDRIEKGEATEQELNTSLNKLRDEVKTESVAKIDLEKKVSELENTVKRKESEYEKNLSIKKQKWDTIRSSLELEISKNKDTDERKAKEIEEVKKELNNYQSIYDDKEEQLRIIREDREKIKAHKKELLEGVTSFFNEVGKEDADLEYYIGLKNRLRIKQDEYVKQSKITFFLDYIRKLPLFPFYCWYNFTFTEKERGKITNAYYSNDSNFGQRRFTVEEIKEIRSNFKLARTCLLLQAPCSLSGETINLDLEEKYSYFDRVIYASGIFGGDGYDAKRVQKNKPLAVFRSRYSNSDPQVCFLNCKGSVEIEGSEQKIDMPNDNLILIAKNYSDDSWGKKFSIGRTGSARFEYDKHSSGVKQIKIV